MDVKINFHSSKVNFHGDKIRDKTCLVGIPNILPRVLANQMRAVSVKYEYADANQAVRN